MLSGSSPYGLTDFGSYLDHPSMPYSGGERHFVETFPLLYKVEGRVYVRSGVRPHLDLRDVGDVAVLHILRPLDLNRRVVGSV